MRENVKNVGLILAIVIAGVSLPTSIMSFMNKPIIIHETIIENHYYNQTLVVNNTIIERYNTTIIEQSNDTGKHIIKPIIYLPALDSGATFNNIWIELNAIGECMYATFFANSDVVDTTEDVIFRFIMNCAQTDASLQMLKSGAHTKMDNATLLSWNIEYETAISFNTTSNVLFIYEYTFHSVDIEDDDWVIFVLNLNEAARFVGIYYAEVEYIHV